MTKQVFTGRVIALVSTSVFKLGNLHFTDHMNHND